MPTFGMAGKGKFGTRGEDAHPRVVTRVVRRQDEGGFRQVELGGNGLHLRRVQSLRVREHGERVAAELAVGEHADRDVVV